MPAHWIIRPSLPQREEVARRLNVSPLMAQLLHNRGIVESDACRGFLNPQLSGLHAPELLPGATEAGELIARAVRDRQRIVIYGDYDVDGITGTAILWHLLRMAGAEVSFYVPHRLEEGYGVNGDALRQLRADGADLVITVDCGVTAIEQAKLAREIGLSLVISDHHAPGEQLPDADGLVHPLIGAGSPNPNLCGAGVAFKLAWSIARQLSNSEKVTPEFRAFLLDATCLAALGTIADVVPLTGENRVLARFGLMGLRESKLHGLKALIASSGLADQKLSCEHVGFWLAPRLNAIGRMGHALLAIEMLTHANDAKAREIAETLEQSNRGRQTLERKIFKQACEMVESGDLACASRRGIVLAREEWHAGVIGIVASRIVERYGRPTVMIALSNGEGQGSARSIRNFELHRALAECGEHLITHGGHAMAAGLRLRTDALEPFTEAFVARANQALTARDLERTLQLDAEVGLDELNEGQVRDLDRLAPFGTGNPKVRLASPVLRLDGEPRVVGKTGEHLSFSLTDGRIRRKAIAFRSADQLQPLRDHRRCRVAFEPILNHFNGRTSVELQVIDFAFDG